jgi:hypothetical protein
VLPVRYELAPDVPTARRPQPAPPESAPHGEGQTRGLLAALRRLMSGGGRASGA